MKYSVTGADRQTGKDTICVVEAQNPEEAKKKAEEYSVFVRDIEVVPDYIPTSTPARGTLLTSGETILVVALIILIGVFAIAGLAMVGAVDDGEQAVGGLCFACALLCGVIIALIRLTAVVRTELIRSEMRKTKD